MSGIIYTCGIEALTNAKHFLNTMYMYGVHTIFDVRNASELRKKQYVSKQEMKELSPFAKMNYVDAGSGFSMDINDRKLLHSKGYIDFEKWAASLSFQTFKKQITDRAINGEKVCLLGYYERPSKCHRFFISSELLKDGFDVQHIGPGTPQLHSALEREEVDKAFPEYDQIAMFEVPKTSYEEKLQKTLKILNKEIGETWLMEATRK